MMLKKIFFRSIHFLISIKSYNINIFPQRRYLIELLVKNFTYYFYA